MPWYTLRLEISYGCMRIEEGWYGGVIGYDRVAYLCIKELSI